MPMSEVKTDLNQLVIFAKVVDTRSFTAAGRALGLPKSTVSRKVAQLEERLGVRLLRRTTRKLSLTEVGAAFYERCAHISTEIDEAEQAITRMYDLPHGLLRVAAPHGFGPTLMVGLLDEFLTRHPQIDLELVFTGGKVDLLGEGFDLTLDLGAASPESETTLGVELGRVRTSLVASHDYLERRGLPLKPEQLEHHELVVLGPLQRGLSLELHGPEGSIVAIEKRPRLVVNSLAVLIEAVQGGVGLGLLPDFCFASGASGARVQTCLPGWTGPELGLHARYPTSRHLSPKLRALIDCLRERLEPAPWPMTTTTTMPARIGELEAPRTSL